MSDFDFNIFKIFNPQFKNYNNNQILYTLKLNNFNFITSVNAFYKVYPNFNLNIYKLFNIDLKEQEDILLYQNWHIKGKYENRISNLF